MMATLSNGKTSLQHSEVGRAVNFESR